MKQVNALLVSVVAGALTSAASAATLMDTMPWGGINPLGFGGVSPLSMMNPWTGGGVSPLSMMNPWTGGGMSPLSMMGSGWSPYSMFSSGMPGGLPLTSMRNSAVSPYAGLGGLSNPYAGIGGLANPYAAYAGLPLNALQAPLTVSPAISPYAAAAYSGLGGMPVALSPYANVGGVAVQQPYGLATAGVPATIYNVTVVPRYITPSSVAPLAATGLPVGVELAPPAPVAGLAGVSGLNDPLLSGIKVGIANDPLFSGANAGALLPLPAPIMERNRMPAAPTAGNAPGALVRLPKAVDNFAPTWPAANQPTVGSAGVQGGNSAPMPVFPDVRDDSGGSTPLVFPGTAGSANIPVFPPSKVY